MRLVWNFEIDTHNLLNFNTLKETKEELRWEARFFWPESQFIVLQGLGEPFLNLSKYKIEHRDDSYLLLANSNFNIKRRRLQLLYKPLLEQDHSLMGYGKKIHLEEFPQNAILPGTQGVKALFLLDQLKENAKQIDVNKEVLIYKLPTEPKIKLELARVSIAKSRYYSVCIDGKSKTLVRLIAKHLLKEDLSCDYVSFLNQFRSNE